jgi:hypothetical protein
MKHQEETFITFSVFITVAGTKPITVWILKWNGLLVILQILYSNDSRLHPNHCCEKVKDKVVPAHNYTLCHKGIWGSGGISPHILNLSISWRWMICFVSLQPYPEEWISLPLDSSVHGSQSWFGWY